MPDSLIRFCPVCRQADDHPRHDFALTDPAVAPHMDCCAGQGCPDGSCDIVIRNKGRKTGGSFRSLIVEQGEQTQRLMDKRDDATRNFTLADLRPEVHGAIVSGPIEVEGPMSALTQARAANFLNAEFGGGTYTALAAGRKLKQIATNGNEATAGTEIAVGGNYAAGGPAITFNAATVDATAPATHSQKIGNAALSITNMPAVTVNGVEVTDAAATPVRSAWGALTTARTTAAGDTLSYPADSVVVRI